MKRYAESRTRLQKIDEVRAAIKHTKIDRERVRSKRTSDEAEEKTENERWRAQEVGRSRKM
eukprot:8102631-Pyramimonas_sp.AAC.1